MSNFVGFCGRLDLLVLLIGSQSMVLLLFVVWLTASSPKTRIVDRRRDMGYQASLVSNLDAHYAPSFPQ